MKSKRKIVVEKEESSSSSSSESEKVVEVIKKEKKDKDQEREREKLEHEREKLERERERLERERCERERCERERCEKDKCEKDKCEKKKKHRKHRKECSDDERKHRKECSDDEKSEKECSDESDSDEEYECTKKHLRKDKCAMAFGSNAFAYVYTRTPQTVALEAPIVFDAIQNTFNIILDNTLSNIIVGKSGIYEIRADINAAQPSQFSIFVNGVSVDTSTSGVNAGAAELTFVFILPLNKGDKVSINNHTSALGPIQFIQNVGGVLPATLAQVVINKIAPIPEDLHFAAPTGKYSCCKDKDDEKPATATATATATK